MDPDTQEKVQALASQHPSGDLVILLGSPTADSAGLYAETVTVGDPTYAGPLAGVSLRLPVYHIVEPAVKAAIPPAVYDEAVGMMEMVLEVDAIAAEMERVRGSA